MRRNVCGAKSCGKVGGMGCSQRPGGAVACCVGRIRREATKLCKNKAAGNEVPCVLYSLPGKIVI